MANKPIKAKINVTKVLKEHLYKGEKGTYLNVVIWPIKGGVDQFGNTHSIQQDIPKAARDAGTKAPYIGEMRIENAISQGEAQQDQPVQEDGDQVPF